MTVPTRHRLGPLIDHHLGLCLLFTAGLLVAGWLMPVMTLRQFVIFTDEVSILGAIVRLFAEGDYALFAIVALFTIAFPVAKLALAALVWWRREKKGPALTRLLARVEMAARWSMLDVFATALFVVVIKISAFSDVTLHAGLYVFIAAVVLSILVVRRVLKAAAAAEAEA